MISNQSGPAPPDEVRILYLLSIEIKLCSVATGGGGERAKEAARRYRQRIGSATIAVLMTVLQKT